MTASTMVIVMSADIVSGSFTFSFHLEPDSMESAFIRRSLSALERLVGSASAHALSEALAAPTDIGSLAQLLSRSDNVGAPVMALEPLAPSLARGIEHREQLLRLAGGTIPAQEAAHLLGISRQAVDKRRKAGSLLAVRQGNDWHYPACQFQQGEVVNGLAGVVQQMASSGPWVTLDFLLSEDAVLGQRTPLQALRNNGREDVLRLVRANQTDGFA